MKIKFRAWDKDKKSLLPVKLIDFFQWLVSCGEGSIERNSFKNERTDRHVLMQCTGVKDRNNKDIYDGDLITRGGLLVPFELYWNTPSAEWWVKRGDDEGWKIDLLYTKMYEVVGNKFEDKHLLEGDNND